MNRKQEEKTREPRDSCADALDVSNPHNRGNVLNFSNPPCSFSREDLINYTEKLAEDARNGTLEGIGGFAKYRNGYVFGLEGFYLHYPSAAILPLIRLQRRIMSQVEEED